MNITLKHNGINGLTVVYDSSVKSKIHLYHENDVMVNPENPDSKLQEKADEIYIETCRGEDSSIASLQGIQKPDELDSLTVV